MEDKELLDRIKKNPDLFQIVYDRYFSAIFSFVVKRTLNYSRSQDITSEVFLKAFVHIQKFEWRSVSLKSWLYKIAVNEIRLWERRASYRPEISTEIFDGAFLDRIRQHQAEYPHEDEENKLAQYRNIIEGLKKVPESQRRCLSLFYLDNLTYQEISEVLVLNLGTVKSNISRGLKKLKKICNP